MIVSYDMVLQSLHQHPEAKKYGQQQQVSEHARECSPIDEIQRAEERSLAQLVMAVHHDRMVGLGWPQITRHPMRRWGGEYGELSDADQNRGMRPDEWIIRVAVTAVPKGVWQRAFGDLQ